MPDPGTHSRDRQPGRSAHLGLTVDVVDVTVLKQADALACDHEQVGRLRTSKPRPGRSPHNPAAALDESGWQKVHFMIRGEGLVYS